MVVGDDDLYDVGMAEAHHHSLRLPLWLWERYEDVAGENQRSPDLKEFMAWRPAHADLELGPDVELPYDFTATFRVDDDLWDAFVDGIPDGDVSGMLRRYIWRRVRHPEQALPSGRRGARHLACV